MLLPLLALVPIEVFLRLSGFGGYEPILKEPEDTPQGRLVVSEQAGTRGFFSANPARPGFPEMRRIVRQWQKEESHAGGVQLTWNFLPECSKLVRFCYVAHSLIQNRSGDTSEGYAGFVMNSPRRSPT